MKHRLYVHIGMPKTGTSSLQKFMALNSEVLHKHGWNYPDTRNRFGNENIEEADRYKNDGLVPFVRADIMHEKNGKAELGLFNERLQHSLKSYDTILSDEGIWMEYGREYIGYLSQNYPDIVLVVYLRRQDFEMESWYKECIKGFRNDPDSFQEWYHKQMIMEENGSLFYRYYDRLTEFEKSIKRENVIVRSYVEDKRFNLCSDFLDAIGLKEKYDEFCNTGQVNSSLSMLDAEVKRKLNEMLRSQPANFETMLQKEYGSVHETDRRFMSSFRFNAEERKGILERYAVQNEKVAKAYLEGQQLFDDRYDFVPAELDKHEVMLQYAELLEKLLLRICYRNAYPFLDFAFNQGKSIAIFGAGFQGKRMIVQYGFPAEIIIDNDEALAGQILGNIRIVTPKEITEWKKYFVIIAVKDAWEIEKQLKAFGLEKNVDFMHMDKILSGGCHV